MDQPSIPKNRPTRQTSQSPVPKLPDHRPARQASVDSNEDTPKIPASRPKKLGNPIAAEEPAPVIPASRPVKRIDSEPLAPVIPSRRPQIKKEESHGEPVSKEEDREEDKEVNDEGETNADSIIIENQIAPEDKTSTEVESDTYSREVVDTDHERTNTVVIESELVEPDLIESDLIESENIDLNTLPTLKDNLENDTSTISELKKDYIVGASKTTEGFNTKTVFTKLEIIEKELPTATEMLSSKSNEGVELYEPKLSEDIKEEDISKILETNAVSELDTEKPTVVNTEGDHDNSRAEVLEKAVAATEEIEEEDNNTTAKDSEKESLEGSNKEIGEDLKKEGQEEIKNDAEKEIPDSKEAVESEQKQDDKEDIIKDDAKHESKTEGKAVATAPVVPKSRPQKASTSIESEHISEPVIKKAPPRVPKKPSSKIAAFQEMLQQQQSADLGLLNKSAPRIPVKRPSINLDAKVDKGEEEESESTAPTQEVKKAQSNFAQNLNGMLGMGLPGMGLPGMAFGGNPYTAIKEAKKATLDSEDNVEKDEATEPAKVLDVRRSRAKGPRGRKLPGEVKKTVEINDTTLGNALNIVVKDLWSIDFNEKLRKETEGATEKATEQAAEEAAEEATNSATVNEENAEEDFEEASEDKVKLFDLATVDLHKHAEEKPDFGEDEEEEHTAASFKVLPEKSSEVTTEKVSTLIVKENAPEDSEPIEAVNATSEAKETDQEESVESSMALDNRGSPGTPPSTPQDAEEGEDADCGAQ